MVRASRDARNSELVLQRLDAAGVMADTRTCNAVVACFALASPARPADAERIFDARMQWQDGCAPANAATFAMLARAYAYARPADPDGARGVLERMRKAEIEPTVDVYNAVLHGDANASPPRVEASERLMGQLEAGELEAAPNRASYNALATAYAKDGAEIAQRGFFQGYSPLVVGVIALEAGGGLVVAVVIKYADNILKSFATAVSIITSTLVTMFFFDFKVSRLFVLGGLLVFVAIRLYSQEPAKALAPKVDESDVELLPQQERARAGSVVRSNAKNEPMV